MIGSLDFETLDTVAYTTVVTDVGMAKIPDATPESLQKVNVVGLRLNVLEQVLHGRSCSRKTLDFHTDQHGTIQSFYEHLQASPFYLPVSMADAMTTISKFFEDCTEIWINGTSFDPVVLTGLCATYKLTFPYKYNKEIDVRTLRKKHDLGNVDAMECVHQYSQTLVNKKHDAISDACWNLKNAVAFEKMVQGWRNQKST